MGASQTLGSFFKKLKYHSSSIDLITRAGFKYLETSEPNRISPRAGNLISRLNLKERALAVAIYKLIVKYSDTVPGVLLNDEYFRNQFFSEVNDDRKYYHAITSSAEVQIYMLLVVKNRISMAGNISKGVYGLLRFLVSEDIDISLHPCVPVGGFKGKFKTFDEALEKRETYYLETLSLVSESRLNENDIFHAMFQAIVLQPYVAEIDQLEAVTRMRKESISNILRKAVINRIYSFKKKSLKIIDNF
tara:strand:+ start:13605 stop:14345 length:741 start_codon:yes stop_codon:yes gene_type:complete